MSPIPKPSRRLARRTAEQEAQRRAILDAALDLFARHGFEGTSMRDVAEAAGFSVGHLYNLIGNKEALFEAVVLREGEELDGMMRAALRDRGDRPVVERLDVLIDRLLEFATGHRNFFRLFLNEGKTASRAAASPLSRSTARLKRRMDRRLRTLFEEGRNDGSLAPIEVADLLAVFHDVVNGFVARWAISGFQGDLRGKTPAIRRVLWNGIAVAPARRRR